MHIYELALRTLLMGFDAAAADADARFVFSTLCFSVDSAAGGRAGGGGTTNSNSRRSYTSLTLPSLIYHLSPFVA